MTHYDNGRQFAIPKGKPGLPIIERIKLGSRTDNAGCWIWQRSKYGNGYGGITVAGRRRLVHRVSYEAFIGPIPAGLTIDHLCGVRACVNPEHMEPVTQGVNSKRGGGLERAVESRRKRTHCPKGHERSPENTGIDKLGKSFCRPCSRAASLSYYHRVKRVAS